MSVLERLQAASDPGLWLPAPGAGRGNSTVIDVQVDHLHEVLATLRDDCGFDMSIFVTAIDRSPRTPRFEVVHELLSLDHNDRIRVRIAVTEENPHLPSAADLWPGVNFGERECYDMFGLHFDGHPDLRRLLMPEGFDHHPLRKDFPHQGIEPDRLYREWERSRSAP